MKKTKSHTTQIRYWKTLNVLDLLSDVTSPSTQDINMMFRCIDCAIVKTFRVATSVNRLSLYLFHNCVKVNQFFSDW